MTANRSIKRYHSHEMNPVYSFEGVKFTKVNNTKVNLTKVNKQPLFLDSSMVEHTAVNRGVAGSSPARGV